MVVVDGLHLAEQVAAALNPMGYAFVVDQAPDWGFRVYLHQLENWPVFLVTSDLFSGVPFFKTDCVFVFKYQPNGQENVILERQMAFSSCSVSAIVAPPTFVGLSELVKAFTFFELSLPLRI